MDFNIEAFKNYQILEEAIIPLFIQSKDDTIIAHGTGFFITKNLILTCYHVIEPLKSIDTLVTYIENTLVSVTPEFEKFNSTRHDLAICRVNYDSKIMLEIFSEENRLTENSNTLYRSIGYPEKKINNKPSSNFNDYIKKIVEGKIVHPKNSDNRYSTDFYSIDAYCLPGMSGGPTVNSDGLVIGMNGQSNEQIKRTRIYTHLELKRFIESYHSKINN